MYGFFLRFTPLIKKNYNSTFGFRIVKRKRNGTLVGTREYYYSFKSKKTIMEHGEDHFLIFLSIVFSGEEEIWTLVFMLV